MLTPWCGLSLFVVVGVVALGLDKKAPHLLFVLWMQKEKNMGIVKMFMKKRSGIYAKVREEAMIVFEREVEKCTLVGNSILDRFQVEASISNTKRRLQEKPLQQKGDLSGSQYSKVIDDVAVEVKRRYVE